ncbi:hypothetical protein KKE99_03310 [Patescibacteria group bacterium]|nr:hypothetical protein [Patescibacteria group bacterium]
MNEENEGIIASLAKTIGNNWRLLLVGVIILAIALNSSWSDNESPQENKNEITPQAEQSKETEQSKENASEENAQNPENNGNNVAQAKEPEIANANTNANTIVQIAAKSEGVTHLARKAIKEYLGSAQENLSAEQKIYAEDYLKRKVGSRLLEVGEKIEFDKDTIKQGIEKAKGLNQKQIENLSKYVPLARNLN